MANGFRFQFRLLNPELTVTRRRLTPNYRADVVLGSRGATKWDKIGQYETIRDTEQSTYLRLDDIVIT